MGRSNVVPTRRNFPSGDSTAMVGTRSVLSCVFTVCRSLRAVSLPLLSTDSKLMVRTKRGQYVECAGGGGIRQRLGGAAPSLDRISGWLNVHQRKPAVLAYGETGDRIVTAIGGKQKFPVWTDDDATRA